FQRNAVFNCRIWALPHLIICSPSESDGQSESHLAHRRQFPSVEDETQRKTLDSISYGSGIMRACDQAFSLCRTACAHSRAPARLRGERRRRAFRPSSKLLLNPEGNEVRLTEKETGVLRYLCRAGQRPVSRETLLQEVWGYNSGLTTHTLETHIYRLRQKIEKDAASPAILVSQAGGYKLVPYPAA